MAYDGTSWEPEGSRKLNLLADFLEQLPDKKYYHNRWSNHVSVFGVTIAQFSACAMMWGALKLSDELGYSVMRRNSRTFFLLKDGRRPSTWTAVAADVFNITQNTAIELFGGSGHGAEGRSRLEMVRLLRWVAAKQKARAVDRQAVAHA